MFLIFFWNYFFYFETISNLYSNITNYIDTINTSCTIFYRLDLIIASFYRKIQQALSCTSNIHILHSTLSNTPSSKLLLDADPKYLNLPLYYLYHTKPYIHLNLISIVPNTYSSKSHNLDLRLFFSLLN